MAKHFKFDLLSESNLFYTKNRSPSFQDHDSQLSESESEHLRQKIKKLEEVILKSNEDFLNRDISRMKEFQEKEQHYINEYEVIQKKYNSLKWKYDSLSSEHLFLQKQFGDFKESQSKEESKLEYFELSSKCRFLESQLEQEKSKRKEKTSVLKAKILHLRQEFQIYRESKEAFIDDLEFKLCKKLSKSPVKSSRTPRKNSVNELQKISSTIVSLEKSQAEYKNRYKNLQRSKVGSFKEINTIYDIIKDNEKRLKIAKKLKEDLFKSN